MPEIILFIINVRIKHVIKHLISILVAHAGQNLPALYIELNFYDSELDNCVWLLEAVGRYLAEKLWKYYCETLSITRTTRCTFYLVRTQIIVVPAAVSAKNYINISCSDGSGILLSDVLSKWWIVNQSMMSEC